MIGVLFNVVTYMYMNSRLNCGDSVFYFFFCIAIVFILFRLKLALKKILRMILLWVNSTHFLNGASNNAFMCACVCVSAKERAQLASTDCESVKPMTMLVCELNQNMLSPVSSQHHRFN